METLKLLRSDSAHPDFIALVKQLDQDLAIRDGADHAFFAQFNKIDAIKHCVIGYLDNQPACSGAIKKFDDYTLEVKRMYTIETLRGNGFAARLLKELEVWAQELGFSRLVLETGQKQPEALRLYHKCGYKVIPNYGQYKDVATSVCFEKHL
ncbi:MAG: GNAT family N-acetyltransferase [Bacteroidia bacterium]